MISVIQVVATAAAALILICGAVQRTEWRGGLLSVAFVFLAAAADFCEPMWEAFLPDWFDEPELVPIVIALVAATCAAAIYKRTTLPGLRAIAKNRRFPILVWGLLCVSILPNVAQNKYLWSFAVTEKESTHNVRETASDAVGFFGAALLLNWAVLFAKDKRKMLRHRPSAHEHLIRENELVPIGHGSRRQAYRIGDTGFCAKFYLPPEECTADKMKNSIRHEIAHRRFSRLLNSSSQEVYAYGKFRHDMPESVRSKMPPVCERVFHRKWGWGVLETYYANPDGTAIIPYRREIERTKDPAVKREIYIQARDLLNELISVGALFHEPGNFHVLKGEDGSVTLKLIDFEPDPKTLIPLELMLPVVRKAKLRRKATRFLASLRERYAIDVKPETEIG